jgi:FkbM family methyltransferase
VNRRDFLIGAASGASSAVVLGAAARAISDRPAAREAQAPSAPVAPAGAAGKSVPKPDPLYEGRRSFAQQGEDLILYNLLHHELKLEAPTYLDIGAGDPVLSNNTYALYCTGSRGVLVEPNQVLVQKLTAVRPGDVVVAAGIGLKATTEADYYVIRGRWPLNTFSREDVAELRRQSTEDPVEKVIKMPLIQINRLIADHFQHAPDLLSIDIEGMDLAVLRSLDYKAHRPAAICAETKKPWMSHDRTPIARLLRTKGYVACAGSLYNTIFVDRARLG